MLFCNVSSVHVDENLDSLLSVDKHHVSYNIFINLDYKCQKLNYKKKNFYKADYDAINLELLETDWENELICNNVDSMTDKFYCIINKLIEKYVPFSFSRISNFPSWYSEELIGLIKCKRSVHFLYKITLLYDYFIEFKRLRARTKRLSKACYFDYIRKIEADCYVNPRAFFSFAKNNNQNVNSVPNNFCLDGNISNDPQSSVELFAF